MSNKVVVKFNLDELSYIDFIELTDDNNFFIKSGETDKIYIIDKTKMTYDIFKKIQEHGIEYMDSGL